MREPVLIYQMGKVGSRSLVQALNRADQWDVYHVHQLNRERLRELSDHLSSRGFSVPEHVRTAEKALERFIDPGRPTRIITMVREPIGRNISAFFQNLDEILGKKPGGALDALKRTRRVAPEDIPQQVVDEIGEAFIEKYPHGVVLSWCDQQLREPLGLDVYEHPFPHDEGVQRLRAGPHEVLVLRCETDDEVKTRAVCDFLGVESLRFRRVNEGDQKAYGGAYRAFKQRVRLPESYLDRMCHSKYARHFYTEDELERVRRRWSAAADAIGS